MGELRHISKGVEEAIKDIELSKARMTERMLDALQVKGAWHLLDEAYWALLRAVLVIEDDRKGSERAPNVLRGSPEHKTLCKALAALTDATEKLEAAEQAPAHILEDRKNEQEEN